MKKIVYGIVTIMALNTFYCAGSPQKSANTGSGGDWIKGEGIAQVYQGDVALAKDRAIRAAKKDAIQRKLGQLIESKTITDSGVWVKGEVTAKSRGLVKDYEVVREHKIGEEYKVTINAHVESSNLKSAVDDILSDWEQPVMFGIIQEKFGANAQDAYDSHTLQGISEFFLSKSFAINKTSSWQGKIKPPLSIEQISQFSEKNEADFDLLVFGKTTCNDKGKIKIGNTESNMISAQVNIDISIFDISTRRLISSAAQHSAQGHIDFESGCRAAIKKASKKLQDNLFKQMLTKWDKEYGSGKTIILEINGTLPYKKLYDLENDLRDQFRGVVDVIERNVNSSKAVLNVIYSGQVKDFSQELIQKKLSVSFDVKEKSGRKIVVQIK
ncbi:MAG: flagellar assembly protein T N-terminal domain-containing protein [Spirochaetia bacterium]|nr:flagellar assembly protein T N-terminal domain-containing protein [Spirochaetia bacterium]